MNGIEVSSAGTAPDAECPVDVELIEWADDVFVMEQRQKKLLAKRFGAALTTKRIVCLGIPDRYEFMQAELIGLLRAKVLPLIG